MKLNDDRFSFQFHLLTFRCDDLIHLIFFRRLHIFHLSKRKKKKINNRQEISIFELGIDFDILFNFVKKIGCQFSWSVTLKKKINFCCCNGYSSIRLRPHALCLCFFFGYRVQSIEALFFFLLHMFVNQSHCCSRISATDIC